MVAGIAAIFLSLRRRPAIRYQAGSELTKRLAMGLYNLAYDQQRELFDFGVRGRATEPVVLIVRQILVTSTLFIFL